MKNKDNNKKIDKIAEHFAEIMKTMGLDLEDDSLKDTPRRVAKMYVTEICRGLFTEPPKMTSFENKGYDQIVVVRDIELFSLCEHHFVPIVGKAHIGYIPNEKVLGLSKLNRTVQYFSARPQLQERIVKEVADYIADAVETEDIIVVTECTHFCSCSRGPRDSTSSTVASFASGRFRTEESIKNEFYKMIGSIKNI